MRTKDIKIVVFLSASLFMFFNAKAQNKETYNEDVIINVDFNPIVNDAVKLTQNPSIFDTNFSPIKLSFERMDKGYHTALKFDTIKPATVKGEPVATLYKTHLKAGIGTYFTPIFEASYTGLRNKSLIYGVDVSSHSSFGKIKNYGNSKFTNDDINLFAKKIFNSYSLTSRAFYNFDRHYFYGSERYDSLKIDKKDYRATYHNVGFEASYTKLERDSSFMHNAYFKINNTSSPMGNHELDLRFLLDMSKTWNLFSKLSNQTLGLTFDYQEAFGHFSPKYSIITLDTNNHIVVNSLLDTWYKFTNTRAIFNFSPYMIFDMKKFHFFASLGVVPKHNGYNKIQILPTATISFELIPQRLNFYGGLKSQALLPTLNEVKNENPYIAQSVFLQDETQENIFAKLFLNILPTAQVSLEAGYTSMRNHHFFYQTQAGKELNVCGVLYDNAKRYYATFEGSYSYENILKFTLNATYQKVNLDSLEYAPYTPSFVTSFKTTYNYQNKLLISLSPTFRSRMKYLNEHTFGNLKPIVDINLSATYNYTEQLHFFIDLENLALQRQYQYYNYPSQKLLAIIGATYCF